MWTSLKVKKVKKFKSENLQGDHGASTASANIMGCTSRRWTRFPLLNFFTFFTFKLVHTESPIIHQLQLSFSYLSTAFCGNFSSGVSALINCHFSYLLVLLSYLGISGLPYDLLSPMDLKRVVNFSVCSAFYLLGWSDDFQAP